MRIPADIRIKAIIGACLWAGCLVVWIRNTGAVPAGPWRAGMYVFGTPAADRLFGVEFVGLCLIALGVAWAVGRVRERRGYVAQHGKARGRQRDL